jgi:type III pantothenate kinase
VRGPRSCGDRQPRWLLIGNSRWHWAARAPTEQVLRHWHTPPPTGDVTALVEVLQAWAAVGPVPEGSALPEERRLRLGAVPLASAPSWLGVDRALAGWQAWRLAGGPVLVADAGTVLSLTRVRGDGSFAGGRLMAGASLQWRAMGSATALLPAIDPRSTPGGQSGDCARCPWPEATEEAMRHGVIEGLSAAVADAVREAQMDEPQLRLVLTGGDGPSLLAGLSRRLQDQGRLVPPLWHRPALVLEALVALAPDQPSPRSARI